jgi:hypothetical protein
LVQAHQVVQALHTIVVLQVATQYFQAFQHQVVAAVELAAAKLRHRAVRVVVLGLTSLAIQHQAQVTLELIHQWKVMLEAQTLLLTIKAQAVDHLAQSVELHQAVTMAAMEQLEHQIPILEQHYFMPLAAAAVAKMELLDREAHRLVAQVENLLLLVLMLPLLIVAQAAVAAEMIQALVETAQQEL